KYQVYVEKVVLDGQGALQLQYEKLKKQLEQEGLFDFEHKKEIPKFPKKIGIVTAKTGAAIRDIMNIAKRRNPYVQLILYPALVQGKEAAASIVKGIKALDGKVDTIIVGRGGGSIEDLWAFNEEIVARAIYEANTPIISGVGHEVDTTISDYVADLRAPTPSAACELAIYEVEQVIGQLNEYKSKMNQVMEHKLAYKKMCLLRQKEKLTYLSPMNQVKEKMQRLADLRELLERNIEQRITKEKHRLQLYLQKLHGLSPTSKLINGYGYITSEKEKPIRGIGDVKEKDMLYITLSDGKLKAQVIDVRKD
ncbi:MAG: exodeoxyribonuclease VII large subunit, partial [Lachnospiraceae bacterium]|nr:exodeoxyribonuclease VII large subunit [Lachnospiraceae bacterium]